MYIFTKKLQPTFFFTSGVLSTSILKGCMFDKVYTPFSYGRGLNVCSSLQEISKTKESTLHVISNVDAAFLLCEAEHNMMMESLNIRFRLL